MVVNNRFHGIHGTEADCHVFPLQLPVKLLQTYLDMQLTQPQSH